MPLSSWMMHKFPSRNYCYPSGLRSIWWNAFRGGGTNKFGEYLVPAFVIDDFATPSPEIYTPNATEFYHNQFWIFPGQIDEKLTICMHNGHNGQLIAICPWLDLVFVKHSHDAHFKNNYFEVLHALEKIGHKLHLKYGNEAPAPTGTTSSSALVQALHSLLHDFGLWKCSKLALQQG